MTLVIYFAITFIFMGIVIDMDNEERIKEFVVSFITGLVWPAIILISIGRYIHEVFK